MGFCRPDSAHCHLKTPIYDAHGPGPWGDRPTARRNLGVSRLRNRRHRLRRAPPCCGVRRRVAFQRRLCQRRDLASKRRMVVKMHFVPRELSKCPATPPCAILTPRTRAPRVSSDSPGGVTARDTARRSATLTPTATVTRGAVTRGAVVAWSDTTFEPTYLAAYLLLI